MQGGEGVSTRGQVWAVRDFKGLGVGIREVLRFGEEGGITESHRDEFCLEA